MGRIIKKIRKIKESRLYSEEKYLIPFLNNLVEEHNSNLVKYRLKNKLILEYDIDSGLLYFDFLIYEKFSDILYERIGDRIGDIDISEYMLELIYKYFNKRSVKNNIYDKEIEDLLIEGGNISYNPLFNSVTGKCIKVKAFRPILV